MAKVRADIEINTGGLADYTVPVVVEYTYYAGCSATYERPGEADTVAIGAIRIIDSRGKEHDADWLVELLEDDEELLGFCALDWSESQMEAEEYRAESRREDAMLAERERAQ